MIRSVRRSEGMFLPGEPIDRDKMAFRLLLEFAILD